MKDWLDTLKQDTSYDGLTYRSPKELRPISFVDSDYAKNIDNRKSVLSGLHTIGGTLVNCESKTQHVVTLTGTEAYAYHLRTN